MKKLTLFSAFLKGIVLESRLQILNPVRMLLVLQSNRKLYPIWCNHSNSQISQFEIGIFQERQSLGLNRVRFFIEMI